MGWTDGIDRAANYIVTNANWNDLLGAAGSLMGLKSHAHGGTTGEGSPAIGPLTTEDFTDAAAAAAPGAGKTRLYAVSGRPRFRAGAAGADLELFGMVGSDADGDIYYRASSALTRLPKGTALQLLRMNAGATAPEWGVPSGITLVAEQATTSGTSIDFTGLPSGVKRVTIMFFNFSTNGTSAPMVQIGDSGGIETTGYLGSASSGGTTQNFTTGFALAGAHVAAAIWHGAMTLTLQNAATNMWVATGQWGRSDSNGTPAQMAASKATSAVLDRVRITTQGGADAFDGGAVSISYE